MMKNLIKYKDKKPLIHDSVYLADGVHIIGDVKINENTSVWFNTVIRGDVNYVRIGKNCNIQDGTIIHVSSYGFSARGEKGSPTIIGDHVTIGHNATIHACDIGDYSLIGMGSVILDQSIIENNAFIAAGAVITPGSLVKSKELWAGNPAKFIRKITKIEEKLLVNTPNVYYQLSKEFLKNSLRFDFLIYNSLGGIMFNKIRNITLIFVFGFISSCGVADYVLDSEDSAPELESDLDLELKSAEDQNFLESEVLNDEIDIENVNTNDSVSISDSDQKLESSPVKEYDSIILGDTDQIENQVKVDDKPKVSLPPIQKLELRDKIQYRIATINFSSGSSLVNYNGLKKIKKIVQIAKERNAKIKIVGHASKRTKDMPLNKHKLVNFSISHNRAQTVANIVVEKYNFPSENLITEAVSDSKPLYREDMPAGTTANQRTEIFIIY